LIALRLRLFKNISLLSIHSNMASVVVESTPQVVTETHEDGSSQALLTTAVTMHEALSKQLKELGRTIAQLRTQIAREQRQRARATRTKAPRKAVNAKPVQVTPAMMTFLTKNGFATDNVTRKSLMSNVCSYIKTKNLQVQGNMRQWKPDEALATLFSESKDNALTFMSVNGLLSRVIVKA